MWTRLAFPAQKALVFCTGVAITLLVFFPGCMSGDAQFSWNESVHNTDSRYRDWHPPLVAFVWHLLNALPLQPVPGYANLFVAMICLFWLGVVLAAEPWSGNRLRWLLFCIGVGMFPPVFAVLSQPLKDSLMCSAMIAAYGALVTAERKRSWIGFFFGLGCLFLATGFRHNAILAVLPLAVWAGFILCEQLASGLPRRLISTTSKVLVGLTISAMIGLAAFSTNRALVSKPTYFVQALYTFDLLAISVKTGKIYLPTLFDDYKKPQWWPVKGGDIDGSPLTLQNLKRLYSPVTNLGIYWYGPGKGLRIVDDWQEVRELRAAWLKAIAKNFLTYVRVRSEMFAGLLGLAVTPFWPYYCMAKLSDPSGLFVYRPLPQFYMKVKDTIFFKGWFYVLLLLLFLIVLSRRGAAARSRVFLACSGMLYCAGYFIIAPSGEFRYLYWPMLACTIIAVPLALTALDAACKWAKLRLDRAKRDLAHVNSPRESGN